MYVSLFLYVRFDLLGATDLAVFPYVSMRLLYLL